MATSHIPLILLTAKATHASRVEGLTRGADDYLTKPFHVDELRLRVHNLLVRQQRLRRYIRQSLVQGSQLAPEPALTDPFITRLYTVLETVLDQPEYSVEQLAEAMAVSYRTLHRKLETLTGMTATELIRSYRLGKAAELLKQGYPVLQVSSEVGFQTPSYFAKCFKEQYGQSPSKFAVQFCLRP